MMNAVTDRVKEPANSQSLTHNALQLAASSTLFLSSYRHDVTVCSSDWCRCCCFLLLLFMFCLLPCASGFAYKACVRCHSYADLCTRQINRATRRKWFNVRVYRSHFVCSVLHTRFMSDFLVFRVCLLAILCRDQIRLSCHLFGYLGDFQPEIIRDFKVFSCVSLSGRLLESFAVFWKHRAFVTDNVFFKDRLESSLFVFEEISIEFWPFSRILTNFRKLWQIFVDLDHFSRILTNFSRFWPILTISSDFHQFSGNSQ